MPSFVIAEKCDGCKGLDRTASMYVCPIENEFLKILVKVNRVIKMNGYYDGIGVEVINKKEY